MNGYAKDLPYTLEVAGQLTTIKVPTKLAEAPSLLFPYSGISSLHVMSVCKGTVVEVNSLCKMMPVYLVDLGQRKQVIWLVCIDDHWVLHLNGGETPPLGNMLGHTLDWFASRGMADAHRRLWANIVQQLQGMGVYPEAFGASPWVAAMELQKRIFINFLRGQQRVVRAKPCGLTRYACALRLTLDTLYQIIKDAYNIPTPRLVGKL